MGKFLDMIFKKKKVYKLSKSDISTDGYEYEPPTQKQLSYATDLGIVIEEDMSKADVSACLDRVLESERAGAGAPYPPASADLLIYSQMIGLTPSPYAGYARAVSEIVYRLKSEDLCAFYIYAVWCSKNKLPLGNPTECDKWADILNLSSEFFADEKAYKSLCTRLSSDYLSPSNGTLCYKAAARLLKNI